MINSHLDQYHVLNELDYKTGASCTMKMCGKMSG